MEYEFVLPPDWIVTESDDGEEYHFRHKSQHQQQFFLTKTAIAMHEDNPESLALIIRLQMQAVADLNKH